MSTSDAVKLRPKQLYRSETNKVIAGVAGGLGEYFDVDPVLIRLIFVLLAVFGGSGVVIYIIMWVLVPAESAVGTDSEEYIRNNSEELKTKAEQFGHHFENANGRLLLGGFLAFLGVAFLFSNFGFFNIFSVLRFDLLWPLIIIAIGILIIIRRTK